MTKTDNYLEKALVKAYKNLENNTLTKADKTALETQWLNDEISSGKACNRCKRKDMPTLDHIIPQDILAYLGFDVLRAYLPENYQVLCRPCNTLKANKLDFGNPKTKELMIKYLERL